MPALRPPNTPRLGRHPVTDPTALRRAFERPYSAALLARFRGPSPLETAAVRPVARLAVLLGGLARFVPFRLPDDSGPPRTGRRIPGARHAAARTPTLSGEGVRPQAGRAAARPDVPRAARPGPALDPPTGRRVASGGEGGLAASRERGVAAPLGQPGAPARRDVTRYPEAAPLERPAPPAVAGRAEREAPERPGESGGGGSELRSRGPAETSGGGDRLPPALRSKAGGERESGPAPGAGELTAGSAAGGTAVPRPESASSATGPAAGRTDDAPPPSAGRDVSSSAPRASPPRRPRQPADRLRATLVERVVEGRLATGRALHRLLEAGWLAHVRQEDRAPPVVREEPPSRGAAAGPGRPPGPPHERSPEEGAGVPPAVGLPAEAARRGAIRRWLHGESPNAATVAAYLGVEPAGAPERPDRAGPLSAESWLGLGPAGAPHAPLTARAPAAAAAAGEGGAPPPSATPADPRAEVSPGTGGPRVAPAESAGHAGDFGHLPRPESADDATRSPAEFVTGLASGVAPGPNAAFAEEASVSAPADWGVRWRARWVARRKAEWARAVGRRGRDRGEPVRGR